jgi:hypothetical protein
MQHTKHILLLFLTDWVILLTLYVTNILVGIARFVQSLTQSPTIPYSSFLVDLILVVIISFIANEVFIKFTRKDYLVSQVLFTFSFLVSVLLLVSLITNSILMNA